VHFSFSVKYKSKTFCRLMSPNRIVMVIWMKYCEKLFILQCRIYHKMHDIKWRGALLSILKTIRFKFCLNHFIEAEPYFKLFKLQETTTNMLYGGKRAETVQYETQIHIYVCYLVIWADFFNGPNVQSTKSRTILLNIFSFVEWWFLYHKDHMISSTCNAVVEWIDDGVLWIVCVR